MTLTTLDGMCTPEHLAAARALQCHHDDPARLPVSPALAAALHLLRRVAELAGQDGKAMTAAPTIPAAFGGRDPSFPTQPALHAEVQALACPRCAINERMAAMILQDLVAPHLNRLGLQKEAEQALDLAHAALSSRAAPFAE